MERGGKQGIASSLRVYALRELFGESVKLSIGLRSSVLSCVNIDEKVRMRGASVSDFVP
jgi:hypothetical protein